MNDRRTKNAEIFRDTERRYTSDSALMTTVQHSIQAQVFIAETDNIIIPSADNSEKAKVIVSGKRSLEAAESYAKQGKKVCVLNNQSRRRCCKRLFRTRGMPLPMHDAVPVSEHRCDVECFL